MSLVVDTLTVEGSLSGAATTIAIQSEITVQKGSANGLAGLDAGGKVPASQLPSFVDDVLEFANLAAFPVTGETGKIYVALDTNRSYRWSGSIYSQIIGGLVDSVFGRTGNILAQAGDYTPAQVGADPSGSAATAQAFAIQRANHAGVQLASTISNFQDAARATLLTGGVLTDSSDLLDTDTFIIAFGKLQAQNNLWSEKVVTAALTNASNATLVNITELQLDVVAGKRYRVEGFLMFRSTQGTTGIGFTVALTAGAVGTIAMTSSALVAGDGTAAQFTGAHTTGGDVVTTNAVPAANTDYLHEFRGIFICTTSGTLTPQFRSETNGQTITVGIGSNIIAREF